jgi:hypothetical protein
MKKFIEIEVLRDDEMLKVRGGGDDQDQLGVPLPPPTKGE